MSKKDMNNYVDYILDVTTRLLAIDSPTGYTKEAALFVMDEYKKLGYDPKMTVKGGVLVEIGGEDEENGLLLAAHTDTLGAMVAEVKSNGNLRVTPLGGMNPNNAETENCVVITRDGKRYEGCFQMNNPSIHVNGSYDQQDRTYDNMEVVLDEMVFSKEETKALGIETGDIVCFETRTRITEKGYIKSRFLDDKLSVAILLGYAKYLKEENITPSRPVYHKFAGAGRVGGDLPYGQNIRTERNTASGHKIRNRFSRPATDKNRTGGRSSPVQPVHGEPNAESMKLLIETPPIKTGRLSSRKGLTGRQRIKTESFPHPADMNAQRG